MKAFIDTNLPIYLSGRSHPLQDLAAAFCRRIEVGEIQAFSSTEVLQEILHRYARVREPKLGAEVYDSLVSLCEKVLDVTLPDTDKARDLLLNVPGISARDAIHAAVMLNNDITDIATFDKDFDRIPGIRRIKLA